MKVRVSPALGRKWTKRLAQDTARLYSDPPLGDLDEIEDANWKPRAPRSNNEERDMRKLVAEAARRWWWPGFRHHMAERSNKREAQGGLSKGVKGGMPDVELAIPMSIRYAYHEPIHAYLELKAEERRPKKIPRDPDWWLDWDQETFGQTRHGLTWSQAKQLQVYDAMGYPTMVAYGWQEAIEWLDEVAGPEPEQMPEVWR